MKTIVTIIGARPQFIKHAPLQKALKGVFNEFVIHTGQHYDINMSDIFFRQMSIKKPDINLRLGSLSHGCMTGRMIEQIEEILILKKPSFVVVYGDTNSTLAGALAAVKLHIPVAHIESGLRSFNKRMPEEINRIVTDRISDVLFAPTKTAINNLKNEGMNGILTGDVMLDAFNLYRPTALNCNIQRDIDAGENYVLLTIHREDNTTKTNLKRIMKNLIASKLKIVFSVHPRTKKVLDELYKAGYLEKKGIKLIEPQGYIENLSLLINSSLIITDSGGMQKEAYFARKQCITLRRETEWTETLDGGNNLLCQYGECELENIFSKTGKLKFKKHFGNGDASIIIVNQLRSLYEDK